MLSRISNKPFACVRNFSYTSARQIPITSAVPTVVQYFNSRGVIIPFADKIFSPEEHLRYMLNESIKLGEVKKLSFLIKEHKKDIHNSDLKQCTELIDQLRTQPYNIPNFLISYWSVGLAHYLGEHSFGIMQNLQELYITNPDLLHQQTSNAI